MLLSVPSRIENLVDTVEPMTRYWWCRRWNISGWSGKCNYRGWKFGSSQTWIQIPCV